MSGISSISCIITFIILLYFQVSLNHVHTLFHTLSCFWCLLTTASEEYCWFSEYRLDLIEDSLFLLLKSSRTADAGLLRKVLNAFHLGELFTAVDCTSPLLFTYEWRAVMWREIRPWFSEPHVDIQTFGGQRNYFMFPIILITQVVLYFSACWSFEVIYAWEDVISQLTSQLLRPSNGVIDWDINHPHTAVIAAVSQTKYNTSAGYSLLTGFLIIKHVLNFSKQTFYPNASFCS